MIYDDIENFGRYSFVAPSIWAAVAEFISKAGALEPGSYPIDGKNCFINVARYSTKEPDAVKHEVHHDYLDIQLALAGRERILVRKVEDLDVVEPYSPERDIAFLRLKADNVTELVIGEGMFAVFYPGEGHLPGCTVGQAGAVHKAIVKIHRSLLG